VADSEATQPDALDLIAQIIRRFYHGDDDSMGVSVVRLAEHIRSHGEGALLDGDPKATVGDVILYLFERIVERMGVASKVAVKLLPTDELLLERTHPTRKPAWAEGVIDQFFAAIERGEYGMEIALKDDSLKSANLAAELEAEIQRRRFADVIVVSHGERSVDLEFLSGNLDVLFGAELDNLEAEKKVVRDFLASGQSSLELERGVSPTEAQRHMGLLVAAAVELDAEPEVGFSRQGSTVVLIRL
jgi:hypothetical protein